MDILSAETRIFQGNQVISMSGSLSSTENDLRSISVLINDRKCKYKFIIS